MSDQQAYNYQIAGKAQSAKDVPASGASAVGYNISGGSGVKLQRGTIVDPTIRGDGQSSVDGLGMRYGTCNREMVLGVSKQDTLWPRMVRVAAWTTIGPFSQTDFTSIVTGANTVVFAGGSARTLGLRRFMRFKISGQLVSTANNGRWLTVKSISVDGRTVTVLETLIVNATPGTTFGITVAKFAYNGAVPVDTYSSEEDFGRDIHGSELLINAKLAKVGVKSGPDAKAIGTFDYVGTDVIMDDVTTTPVFSSPVYPTGYNMEISDGFIIKDGVASNVITDYGFTYDMGGEVEKVLGAVGRDVSLSPAKVSGNISAIRTDLAWIKAFKAKTAFETMVVFQEPESDPIDFLSFGFGNCMGQSPDKNMGATGTTKDAAQFTAGIDERGGDCALATCLISSSAP